MLISLWKKNKTNTVYYVAKIYKFYFNNSIYNYSSSPYNYSVSVSVNLSSSQDHIEIPTNWLQ